ncbi:MULTISPECIES: ethanolamine ammonia-lyase subunit EutC [Nitrospirillum]|uniref:Ethanolamine ammonia-lyase small subunit n=1 Tax=Nitrospirillum amazonense TaxID=28077 RepID=A0A560FKN5_9PROT|nr:ethanolamine ammonia-lyase subunit EutC [Nitrospirillum amazonense]MEC4590789.1 ethanolamine ammonia-lyase subunit EutC [Nitrospirillum amazonense]TWB22176.1 ethanolamine ammonia-lyase light chain [Nitrospirillum amazonense]
MDKPTVTADAWAHLAAATPARIALGRAGDSLPTAEVLRFALAHAQARDAVHTPFDAAGLVEQLAAWDLAPVAVHSAAPDRATYLSRPDLGRLLDPVGRQALTALPTTSPDLAIVIADGLSATAVHRQAMPLLTAFLPWARREGWRLAPVVVASQARVALGDAVGQALGARAVAVLIGERPGLSAPDSLGVYLTLNPAPGRLDAERNCLSNIRDGGLSHDLAAFKLAWLLRQALRRQVTGVALKDESDRLLVDGRSPMLLAD